MTVKISALPGLSEAIANSDLFAMVNVSVTTPDATGQTQRILASELKTYIGGVTSVDLTAPAAGITVSGGPITTSGSITLALANDLAALEALSGTNTIYYRSGSDTWSPVTISTGLSFSGGTLTATGDGTGTVTSVAATAPAAGFTISGSPITTAGTFVFALADDLAALEGLAGTGIAARTAANTWAQRTITGTADKITVTDGDGVAGNPTLTIAATYVGQTSITTLGTVATGTWNATPIATAKGGVPAGGPEAYSLVKATSGDYDVTWASMQPSNANLTTIAGLTGATDKGFYFTGGSTMALYDLTSAGRSMSGAADAAAQTALLTGMVGDSGSGGTKGLVPAPSAGDATKLLRGDGTWVTPTGGTVTSVGLTVPSWLSVANSPVTTSATLDVTAATGQTANRFLATPDGTTGAVSLRAITLFDLPAGTATNAAYVNVGNVSGSVTADVGLYDRFRYVLTGNTTFAVSNDANGATFMVAIKQDGTGGHTITWWSGITWDGGSAPTQVTTANKQETYVFFRESSGVYRGQRVWKDT